MEINKLDVFYGLIFSDEMNMVGAAGIITGLATGTAVGLPLIMDNGTKLL